MADKKISALISASTPLAGTEVLPIVQSGATVKVAVSDLTAGRSVNVSNLTANGGNLVATTGGYVASDTYYNYGSALKISAGGSLPIYFQINNVTKVTLSTTGGFSIGDATDPGAGNLRMAIGNIISATAGKGINFTANTPAAGMTSQLLNWYEEGTWTPVNTGFTIVSGSLTAVGTYTRIGNQVTVIWRQTGGSVTTVAGSSRISGLPFVSGSFGTVVGAGSGSDTAQGCIVGLYNGSGTMTLYIANVVTAVGGLTITCTYFI
jgi:hypothetical protein